MPHHATAGSFLGVADTLWFAVLTVAAVAGATAMRITHGRRGGGHTAPAPGSPTHGAAGPQPSPSWVA